MCAWMNQETPDFSRASDRYAVVFSIIGDITMAFVPLCISTRLGNIRRNKILRNDNTMTHETINDDDKSAAQ